MLTQIQLQNIAQTLIDEHEKGVAQTPLPESSTASLEDAYRAQDVFVDESIKRSGAAVRGYKIALTSAAMQQMVNVDQPVAGVLLDTMVFKSPYACALGSFQHVGLEFEVAVSIGESLTAANGLHTRESVADSIAGVAPAFELVEDRRADYTKIDAFSLIADNCWNGGNVIGEFVSPSSVSLDLGSARAALSVDGNFAEESSTGAAMGHPYEVVAWMANLLNQRGRDLEAGMLVMTGSSMQTRFPVAGEIYEFSIDGLGSVTIRAGA